MERCFHSNPACLPFLQPFLLDCLEAMNRVYNKIFLIQFLLWIFKHKNYIRVIKETLMYLPPSWIINKITIGEAPCVVPLFGYKIILSSKCWKEKKLSKIHLFQPRCYRRTKASCHNISILVTLGLSSDL